MIQVGRHLTLFKVRGSCSLGFWPTGRRVCADGILWVSRPCLVTTLSRSVVQGWKETLKARTVDVTFLTNDMLYP